MRWPFRARDLRVRNATPRYPPRLEPPARSTSQGATRHDLVLSRAHQPEGRGGRGERQPGCETPRPGAVPVPCSRFKVRTAITWSEEQEGASCDPSVSSGYRSHNRRRLRWAQVSPPAPARAALGWVNGESQASRILGQCPVSEVQIPLGATLAARMSAAVLAACAVATARQTGATGAQDNHTSSQRRSNRK